MTLSEENTIGCVSASDVDNNTDLRDAVGYNSNLDSSMLSDSPLGSSNITIDRKAHV